MSLNSMERERGQLWLKMSSQTALKDEKGVWIWINPLAKTRYGQ